MLYRIEAGLFPHLDDTIGRKTAASIREALGIPVKSVRTIKVFTLEGLDAQQVNTLMAKSVLHDPVLQAVSLSPLPLPEEGTSWIIEVGYRPGVTDNEGRTARDTAALELGIEDRSSLAVYTSIQYRLHGPLTESFIDIKSTLSSFSKDPIISYEVDGPLLIFNFSTFTKATGSFSLASLLSANTAPVFIMVSIVSVATAVLVSFLIITFPPVFYKSYNFVTFSFLVINYITTLSFLKHFFEKKLHIGYTYTNLYATTFKNSIVFSTGTAILNSIHILSYFLFPKMNFYRYIS